MTTSVYPRWQGDATPAFVQNLADDLAMQGHHVRVLAPHFKGCPTINVENGVSIHRHHYAWPSCLQTLCYEGGMLVRLREARWRKALLPLFAASQYRALHWEIRHFKPDIVHAHSLVPQGWIASKALSSHTNVPLIVSSHGNDVFGLHGRYMKLKRQTAERADCVVANSKATRAAMFHFCSPEKIEIIPASPNRPPSHNSHSFADAFSAKHGDRQRQLIMFAGRLIPEKGIELLLDAFPEILRRVPTAKLIVCGDGPLAPKVKTIIANWEQTGDAAFLGWVPNETITSFFSKATIVAVPSQPQHSGWEEAQGLVAVEAMAAGAIVVASRLGGLAESIVDGETGFLVEPNNRAQWIDTIVSALTAPASLRETWAAQARERYRAQFSREASAQKTIELYRTIIARRCDPQQF